MPAMPRLDNKTRKIAYKILGVPANMFKKTKKEQKLDDDLARYETVRIR